MGRIVRLVSSGIGLASEAIAHHKSSTSKTSALSSNPSLDAGEGSSSAAARHEESYDDAPPQYVEVADNAAERMIEKGDAVTVDSKEAEKTIKKDYNEDEDVGDDHADATSEEGDEEQWELDETTRPVEREDSEPAQDIKVLWDNFMRMHPPPGYTSSQCDAEQGKPARGSLPCPVIIPQRRPRDKTRGFIRAYALVLENCGIDQSTFMDFLKTFHAACKADSWLQVVNIAAIAAGNAPSAIATGVGIAVQFAVGVAMEVQRRTRSAHSPFSTLQIETDKVRIHRTNNFLGRMNNDFFKPHGLYCLIMTYKPDSTVSHARIDINETITTSMNPASSDMLQILKNMRLSSGQTFGELEMPEAAPLIFPELEDLASSSSPDAVQNTNKLKSSQKFVAEYFDRRAQAQYAGENPGSTLAASGPETKFESRFADPNHAANSGSLSSLLTGGKFDLLARRMEKKGDRRVRKALRRGENPEGMTHEPRKRNKKGGVVKRILKKDVLYLMIVNLPSEEEMAWGKESVTDEML